MENKNRTSESEEKVILTFVEIAPEKLTWPDIADKRYEIVHLNKLDPRTPDVVKGFVSRDVSIANYVVGIDRPNDYLIGKRYDSRLKGVNDVVVVPKGNPIEEKLYEIALKYAEKYAKEEGLEFEDQSNFQLDPLYL